MTTYASAGFDEMVTPALQAFVDRGELAGMATLAWQGGEIRHVGTIGWQDVEKRVPMSRDTLFRIASMTKPLTSCLAMMMVEEGALSLDDPITKWAPEFTNMRVLRRPDGGVEDTVAAKRPITIDDLLTHRAGFAYHFACPEPIARAYEAALKPPVDYLPVEFALDPDAWLLALARLPLVYQPGDRYLYSHATDVLGFLLGRIAAVPFRTLLIERLLRPLGMSDTDFWVPPEKRHRLAVLYNYSEAEDRLVPAPTPEHDQPPAFSGGGGGLVSSLDDYLTFARFMLGEGEVDGVRLLKSETVRDMLVNRLTPRQREDMFLGLPLWAGAGFGLGVSMVLDPALNALGIGNVGAFNWPGAHGTWWLADPAEDLIMIYMTQHKIPLVGDWTVIAAGGKDVVGRFALPVYQNIVYPMLID